MNTKPILAYDCACFGASIALKLGEAIHMRELEQHQQAAELVPAIDDLLRVHSVAYRDLECIVSTIGPGSFTGVRIGLAALHGFVLVSETPVKLLSTLEAIAWQIAQMADAPPAFYVALRAGKGEVYAQQFDCTARVPTAQGDIFLAPEGKMDWSLPCFGNSVEASSPHYLAGPDASTLCAIAGQLPTANLADAIPLYVRPPDAIAAAPHAWLTMN